MQTLPIRDGPGTAARPRVVAGCAACFVALILSSELTFRRRDPTLALAGEIDQWIMLELAIWGLVGVWCLLQMFADRRLTLAPLMGLGTGLGLLAVTVGVFAMSTVYAPSRVSVVRGGQYLILILLTILAYHEVADDTDAAARLWRLVRRWAWMAMATAVLLAFAVAPLFGEWTPVVVPGAGPRYQLFSTHPITTGGLLGLAMISLASGWLTSVDPWLDSWRNRLVAMACFGGLGVLLLATKSRGPLAATAVGLMILTLLSPYAQRRAVMVLAGIASCGAIVAGVGSGLLGEVVTRGQTGEQLLSLTGRTRLFEVAWNMFMERPIVGYGYHAARSLYLERVPWAGHSHNAWFEVAINNGLVGLVLVCFLLGVVALRLGGRLWAADETASLWARDGLALLAFVGLLGVISPGFAGAPGYEATALAWLVLLADLAQRRVVGSAALPSGDPAVRSR